MGMQPIVFQVYDKRSALFILASIVQEIRSLTPEFSNIRLKYDSSRCTSPKKVCDEYEGGEISLAVPLFQKQDGSDAQASIRALWLLLEGLSEINQVFLTEHPETMPLYNTGVVYRPEFGSENWQDIPTTLAKGHGDCEDLAAWEVAEYRVRRDTAAHPYLRWQMHNNAYRFHALGQLPDGSIIDPSLKLGMAKWNDFLANS